MKQTQKNIFYLVFALIFSFNALAKENGKIKGIVVNNDDKKPLISATIVLHKQKDSAIAGGAITDKKGNFTISATDGDYYLAIKYVGFATKYIDSVKLIADKVQTLDTIKLVPDNVLQEDVIVEAEKEQVEIGIDSRKYNISKDQTAGESNVLDVLRKIPSVEVDMEDNIKMNGSSPKILIDGRESQMANKDMLKVLSSDLVESVELITNPSAKYESEGVTGIIDIKLKKEIDRGFNAMISAGYGRDFEFKYNNNANAGLYSNLKLGKLNIFARLNYSNYGSVGNWAGQRTTWMPVDAPVPTFDTVYNDRYGDNSWKGNWYGADIGFDYEFTKKDVMTFSIDYSGSKYKNTNYSKYSISGNTNLLLQDYENIAGGNSNNFDGSISLYYKKEFEEKGHNLYFDAYYNNEDGKNNNKNDYFYYPILATDTLFKKLFNTDDGDKNKTFTLKIDYEKTFELFGNFGAGIRLNTGKLDDEDNSYQYSYLLNDYELNRLLSDKYLYNSSLYSAYFTLGKKWTSFSYRLGLRAEYLDWEFNSNPVDTIFGKNYLALMPSIHLKYMIGFTHTFGVGYSRRINRPWNSQYNPFMIIFDSTTVNRGNPNLEPSYYNSFDVNYMLYTPNTTINVSAYFNNTDNSSQSYNTTTDWGGILTYPINAGINQRLGASLSIQQKITDWWSLNLYSQLYHSKLSAPSIGIGVREQTSWSANANTYIEIIKNLRISSYFYFSPSSITLQGSNAGWYGLGCGASYSMLDDKLSLRLNLSNLLVQNNHEYISFGEYFYSKSNYNWQHRQFSIGLSYKINNYQESMKRMDEEGGGGNQGGGQGGGGGRI